MSDETTEKSIQIVRYKRKNKYFTENLGNGIGLEMVLIPGGTFLMGSPENELEHLERESPQHEVTLQPFFMGRYTVTQAQWRVVAGYPQIERKLNPDPSQFKGDNHPVEIVSWNDATEFCKRLSVHTGRQYKLPSEAQWEYACRAGTTTPFHFGETIAPDLANYRGIDRITKDGTYSGSYGSGPKAKLTRKQTTDVGYFPANEWGLHDMHGNVFEWCEDHYHDSYEGAPTDGSAWIEEDRLNTNRVMRGGSWTRCPRNCRSAYRSSYISRDFINDDVGFRIVCVIPKT